MLREALNFHVRELFQTIVISFTYLTVGSSCHVVHWNSLLSLSPTDGFTSPVDPSTVETGLGGALAADLLGAKAEMI